MSVHSASLLRVCEQWRTIVFKLQGLQRTLPSRASLAVTLLVFLSGDLSPCQAGSSKLGKQTHGADGRREEPGVYRSFGDRAAGPAVRRAVTGAGRGHADQL